MVNRISFIAIVFALMSIGLSCHADNTHPASTKLIEGTGDGWRAMTEAEFENVNCADNTWVWKDGIIYCTGQPIGVCATKRAYTNFEFVVEWRHMKHAGNSGVFVWATKDSLNSLKQGKGRLPQGIEVQVLDLGYAENWEKKKGKKPDWFTCHGDVFPVGKAADMKPFPPAAPNGKRSFPTKNLSKGIKLWNHYYVRCVNGEVRLSVNGEEVSGGKDCKPTSGYFCLESEGSPIEFRNLSIRELE